MLLRDMAADYGQPDPTARVRPPDTHTEPRRETRTLTGDELARVLQAARALVPQRLPEIATLALTGIRVGELAGLKWDDLDVNRGILHIRRSASAGHVTSPKTHAHREVYVPFELLELLQEQQQWLLDAQHPGLADGWMFPSDVGTPRFGGSLRKALRRLERAADVEVHITPQVLRRTFNTLMVAQGVDRVVLRAQMGHTTEAMTVRYAGIRPETLSEQIGGLIGPLAGHLRGHHRGHLRGHHPENEEN